MKHLGFYFPNPIKIRNPNLMLTIIKFFKRGMDEIIEMILAISSNIYYK